MGNGEGKWWFREGSRAEHKNSARFFEILREKQNKSQVLWHRGVASEANFGLTLNSYFSLFVSPLLSLPFLSSPSSLHVYSLFISSLLSPYFSSCIFVVFSLSRCCFLSYLLASFVLLFIFDPFFAIAFICFSWWVSYGTPFFFFFFYFQLLLVFPLLTTLLFLYPLVFFFLSY